MCPSKQVVSHGRFHCTRNGENIEEHLVVIDMFFYHKLLLEPMYQSSRSLSITMVTFMCYTLRVLRKMLLK